MIKPRHQKRVVTGNGMAGARVLEEILRRANDSFDISMFGAEPCGTHSRIPLGNAPNLSYQDPWKEAEGAKYPQQLNPPQRTAILEVAENHG